MHLYNKEDLAKLKDSKPIQITAHTHECIVPVVYSGMVNRFLEKKGVHLPLTHHQLADMKREAGTPGYAKGTKDLKKGKKKGKGKAVNVSQNVVVNVTRPVRSARPSGAKALYNTLRPSNYEMIRSAPLPGIKLPYGNIPDTDFAKAQRDLKAKEDAMLEHYKKETEQRVKQMDMLNATMQQVLREKQPLYTPPSSVPLRKDDFNTVQLPSPPILLPRTRFADSPPKPPPGSAKPAGWKDMSNPPLPPPFRPLDPGDEYTFSKGIRYRKVYVGKGPRGIGDRYKLVEDPL